MFWISTEPQVPLFHGAIKIKMKSSKGFTLLEVVVSLGILALGVLGIFSLIPTGVEQSQNVHEQSKAILLAQSKLEEIIAQASTNWEGDAAKIQDGFNTWSHYQFNTPKNEPSFLGPNTLKEKEVWGWVEDKNGKWVEDVGYQWEWHFVAPENAEPAEPPYTGSLALVTLTVSWPQKWSSIKNLEQEKGLVARYRGNDETYFKNNNIQYVRLISYVSKGL